MSKFCPPAARPFSNYDVEGMVERLPSMLFEMEFSALESRSVITLRDSNVL